MIVTVLFSLPTKSHARVRHSKQTQEHAPTFTGTSLTDKYALRARSLKQLSKKVMHIGQVEIARTGLTHTPANKVDLLRIERHSKKLHKMLKPALKARKSPDLLTGADSVSLSNV